METYRHEYKYLISENALASLSTRLKGVLKPDPHAGKNGRYLIRSLYFDDMYDTCYRENEDGQPIHEKFRIRAYNGDISFIVLELKRKERGKTLKLSEVIDEKKYRFLAFDEGSYHETDLAPLSRKLLLQKRTRLLKPKIIIQYEREPFILREGNVRVTFDRNISASIHLDRMFEDNTYPFPVLNQGVQLLEVKWDLFLPETVERALNNMLLQSTAFSKYYIGRERASL